MIKKIIELKKKLINHIMIDGNKKIAEKLLLKSAKEVQQDCNKKTNEIFKLALFNTTPIFRINKIKNKKMKKKALRIREIPAFIKSDSARFSLAMKTVLKTVKKKSTHFFFKLTKEILLSSQQESEAVQIKDAIQDQVLLKKHFLRFYRW